MQNALNFPHEPFNFELEAGKTYKLYPIEDGPDAALFLVWDGECFVSPVDNFDEVGDLGFFGPEVMRQIEDPELEGLNFIVVGGCEDGYFYLDACGQLSPERNEAIRLTKDDAEAFCGNHPPQGEVCTGVYYHVRPAVPAPKTPL